MITVLVGGPAAAGDTVTLEADEAHHLRVRRVGESRVAVRDGAGFAAEGTIVGEERTLSVRLDAVSTVAAPPPLVLGVGAGDRERFAMVVEKGAELGVTRIVPLETAHARSVGGRVRPEHVARLRRRALEAIKQSGAAWAPVVAEPLGLDEFLASDGQSARAAPVTRWLADAAGTPPPARLPAAGAVIVLVGPEGGLTADERAAAIARGYTAISVGPHVLRFETAATAAAVAVHIARRRGSE